MPRLVVEQERGGVVEASHEVSAVLVEATGVADAIGPDLVTTWRSAAKPFQLETSLEALPAEWRGSLVAAELAVGAASHSGEQGHVARVRSLLARFGLDEEHLYCGAHAPVYAAAADDLVRRSEPFLAVHNNCSGKHAFMAGASRASGWDADYRHPDHPLQVRIRDRITERAGQAPQAVVDGCGVPCWVLPISAMARAWSVLAAGTGSLGAIGDAMRAHPWETAGTGRPEVTLMRTAARPLACKVGAEGLMCGALVEQGAGFAIKVHSGNALARAVATWAVLDRWSPGLLAADGVRPWSTVHDVVGRDVGALRAVWID